MTSKVSERSRCVDDGDSLTVTVVKTGSQRNCEANGVQLVRCRNHPVFHFAFVPGKRDTKRSLIQYVERRGAVGLPAGL